MRWYGVERSHRIDGVGRALSRFNVSYCNRYTYTFLVISNDSDAPRKCNDQIVACRPNAIARGHSVSWAIDEALEVFVYATIPNVELSASHSYGRVVKRRRGKPLNHEYYCEYGNHDKARCESNENSRQRRYAPTTNDNRAPTRAACGIGPPKSIGFAITLHNPIIPYVNQTIISP